MFPWRTCSFWSSFKTKKVVFQVNLNGSEKQYSISFTLRNNSICPQHRKRLSIYLILVFPFFSPEHHVGTRVCSEPSDRHNRASDTRLWFASPYFSRILLGQSESSQSCSIPWATKLAKCADSVLKLGHYRLSGSANACDWWCGLVWSKRPDARPETMATERPSRWIFHIGQILFRHEMIHMQQRPPLV